MPEFTDQTGRKISLDQVPQRIVSTVPSQTELLYDLGLGERVVGVTAYCVHPAHCLEQKTVIGGTKDLRVEKIKSLQPDLIIGNKEENEKEQIEELAADCPVWLSDIKTLEDAVEMIVEVGKITGSTSRAGDLSEAIEKEHVPLKSNPVIPAAYFIWKDPYMLASRDTFINSMLELCGCSNVITQDSGRYPEVELADLEKQKPRLILLSSEPYPFTVGDLHELAESFPDARLKIVDGQLFSWYGSRILKALPYFSRIREELNLLYFRNL